MRLAVGEACGRAVQRSESAGGAELVQMVLTAASGVLVVEVVDGAVTTAWSPRMVAMLLMEGLADEVSVSRGPRCPGGTTRLTWGLPADAAS